jgi:hypothetical protein
VTIIEGKTGFVMVGKLLNKTTVRLNNKTKALINRALLNSKQSQQITVQSFMNTPSEDERIFLEAF